LQQQLAAQAVELGLPDALAPGLHQGQRLVDIAQSGVHLPAAAPRLGQQGKPVRDVILGSGGAIVSDPFQDDRHALGAVAYGRAGPALQDGRGREALGEAVVPGERPGGLRGLTSARRVAEELLDAGEEDERRHQDGRVGGFPVAVHGCRRQLEGASRLAERPQGPGEIPHPPAPRLPVRREPRG
jgi:hypothetical protein